MHVYPTRPIACALFKVLLSNSEASLPQAIDQGIDQGFGHSGRCMKVWCRYGRCEIYAGMKSLYESVAMVFPHHEQDSPGRWTDEDPSLRLGVEQQSLRVAVLGPDIV